MDWVGRMNKAVDYIESNLAGSISYDKAAKIACCSSYHFQRMFSYIANIPLSEYIRRRRLTLAAAELKSNDEKIIDISFKYGYESPEAFSRAFKKMHGVTPAAVRDKGVNIMTHPKITFSISIEGDTEMNFRIEQCEAFELCGISTVIKGSMTPPKFIRQCYKNGKLNKLITDLGIERLPEDDPKTPGEVKNLVYALYDFKDETFSYMICYYMPKDGLPPGCERLSVPSHTWAVFTSPEDIGADPALHCKRARSSACEWFAASEYERAPGPELEKGFNYGNMNFRYEVWIPVVKR
ncbi:MAG: AraC family transcriptional regulator [Clostridiales bacterium]|jgi:AraC family transcriptional regulator|nr:AraC family transcriptional regulator [Clostridiales bacterium]